MTGKSTLESTPADIFGVLGDPIRWSIITQAARVDELACLTLESTLPVAKPTISYHVKILHRAGLIRARKSGRNHFYSLRRDVLHKLLDDLRELAPAPRAGGTGSGQAGRRRAGRQDDAERHAVSGQLAAGDEEAVVLTW